ncbi:unnamed protein product [Aphis gossypii]|uniref:Uncharacterized protein n=1 Tax=Aphis gossypii TaxID=80765 RepID=A0A9P0NIC8_APHGO|nr:unnamed protein product [Aphis gossypii]
MDKDSMIELSEFHNNLYGFISDSRENLIEKPPEIKPRKKKLLSSNDIQSIGSSSSSSSERFLWFFYKNFFFLINHKNFTKIFYANK